MNELILPAGFIIPHTPEWYKVRIGMITSSNVGKLAVRSTNKSEFFGQGATAYLWKVIGEMLTGISKEIPETEAVLWGLTEEPYAKAKYVRQTGQSVTDSFWITHNQIFGGTNDGAINNSGSIDGVIEIKNFDSEKHARICAMDSQEELQKFDKEIYWQCQANRYIIPGAKYCDFISHDSRVLNPDLQIKIIRILPDPDWEKEFELTINEAAAFINDKITKILSVPELNARYRKAA